MTFMALWSRPNDVPVINFLRKNLADLNPQTRAMSAYSRPVNFRSLYGVDQ